ncbi:MAG: hypothetical protein IJ705_07450 [Oscillospiraceae bacterium]|nr:hypothetical protein [Oscillospiraceae bacterium]
MSNLTAEALRLMDALPEAEQALAVNLIRDVLNAWRVKNEIPNAETAAALEEGEDMVRHPENYPSYHSFDELMEAVLHEPEHLILRKIQA